MRKSTKTSSHWPSAATGEPTSASRCGTRLGEGLDLVPVDGHDEVRAGREVAIDGPDPDAGLGSDLTDRRVDAGGDKDSGGGREEGLLVALCIGPFARGPASAPAGWWWALCASVLGKDLRDILGVQRQVVVCEADPAVELRVADKLPFCGSLEEAMQDPDPGHRQTINTGVGRFRSAVLLLSKASGRFPVHRVELTAMTVTRHRTPGALARRRSAVTSGQPSSSASAT